jgi:hypothetical protein
MENNQAGLVVGDDALGQVAVVRVGLAGLGADKAAVKVGPRRTEREKALQRVPEIAGLDQDAVGVTDAGAEPEIVRAAPVCRHRDLKRQVGHQP